MQSLKSYKKIIIFIFLYLIFSAHSPWGQYLAYRDQHLLIMSVIEDEETYPYSKVLVEVINKYLPEASARPARARTFERVQSLFKTNQMPLVILSSKNAKALIKGNGPFKNFGSAEGLAIYYFNDLVLLAQPTFPSKFAWLVTKAISDGKNELEGAKSPLDIKQSIKVHPGTLEFLNNKEMPELKN